MKKLDDLIKRLGYMRGFNSNMMSDPLKPQISEQMKLDILEQLQEIQADIDELHKCVPVEQSFLQAGRFAQELGIPQSFKNWMLQDFDIEANPSELPTLTCNYIYHQKDEK